MAAMRADSLFASTAKRASSAMASGQWARASSRISSTAFGRPPVIGRIEKALIDFRAWHKAINVDRVGALDLDRLQLLIFDEEELAFADLVAPSLLGALDRFAGLLIDKLLAQPVAGLAVDLAKRNPFRSRTRGMKRYGAGDEGELEIAFPVWTR